MEAKRYRTTPQILKFWRKNLMKKEYRSLTLCRVGNPFIYWKKREDEAKVRMKRCWCDKGLINMRHIMEECELMTEWRENIRATTGI